MSMALEDTLHRPLRDLRVSITDRCNFRCVYCMPKEVYGRDYAFLPRRDLLTFEEIARLARVFAGLGVEKIRLTGGEPLIRRQVDRLVGMLAEIPGLELTLTTNGAVLAQKAQALKDAGLRRITVSLDSLDDEVFRAMNDVEKRGVNEDGVLPMARHFRDRGHTVRFIEYMDVGHTNGWRLDDVVPAADIVAAIDTELPLEPLPPRYPGEVAERYRYRDGSGEIGVIASVTRPFCGACTRARLSADGSLYTCLFATTGHDLRGLMREGAADDEIAAALVGIWRERTDRYSELRSSATPDLPKVEMSYIGG